MSISKKVVCHGEYYNYKKGMEQCKNKCSLFNENSHYLVANCNYSVIVFRYIKDFRTCDRNIKSSI